MQTRNRLKLFAGLAAALSVATLGGCAGYSSYPHVEGAKLANPSPDYWPTYELAGRAVRYVADRYPPSAPSWVTGEVTQAPDRFVINLPTGAKRDTYLRAVAFAGQGAEGPTGDNAGLPVYHVNRIWVRGRSARVEVLRPIAEIGPTAQGTPVYQAITVFFEGGLEPWKITGRQVQDSFSPDAPALAMVPGTPTQAAATTTTSPAVLRSRTQARALPSLAASDPWGGAVQMRAQLAAAHRQNQQRFANVPTTE